VLATQGIFFFRSTKQRQIFAFRYRFIVATLM
jgi:hypothetical protein